MDDGDKNSDYVWRTAFMCGAAVGIVLTGLTTMAGIVLVYGGVF